MFDKIMDWIKSVLNPENPKLNLAKNATEDKSPPITETLDEVIEEPKKVYAKSDLNKLTKAKLLDLAKNEFDSELDPKLKKPDLVGVILKLQE